MLLDAEPHFAAPFQQHCAVVVPRNHAAFIGAAEPREVFQHEVGRSRPIWESKLVCFLAVVDKLNRGFVYYHVTIAHTSHTNSDKTRALMSLNIVMRPCVNPSPPSGMTIAYPKDAKVITRGAIQR